MDCKASPTGWSAFWVGLDGDTTSTVEQTGTEADCSSGSPAGEAPNIAPTGTLVTGLAATSVASACSRSEQPGIGRSARAGAVFSQGGQMRKLLIATATTLRLGMARARGRVAALLLAAAGLAVLWGVVSVVVALPGPAAAAAGGSSHRAAMLTAAIKRAMRRESIPGAIVGVWQRDRAPYVRAFGVRDKATGQPMTTNLRMRIASITKTFLGTALLELVDKGEVRLDAPISKYVAGVPHGNEITIRELAENRSGLVDYFSNKAFLRVWLTHPRREWTPRQLLAYSFSKPLLFTPGTNYNYSNTNFILLGLVMQRASHQPLATYIKQHILEPDHLTHTSFPPGAVFPVPHAQGYTNETVRCYFDHACKKIINATSWYNVGWASAAMVSTLGDLHHWARDLATGKLLTPAAQRQRTRFIPIPGSRHAAYGLALARNNGWIGHSGAAAGYLSLSVYLPSQRATLVVLINSNVNDASLPALATAITKIITPKHVY